MKWGSNNTLIIRNFLANFVSPSRRQRPFIVREQLDDYLKKRITHSMFNISANCKVCITPQTYGVAGNTEQCIHDALGRVDADCRHYHSTATFDHVGTCTNRISGVSNKFGHNPPDGGFAPSTYQPSTRSCALYVSTAMSW